MLAVASPNDLAIDIIHTPRGVDSIIRKSVDILIMVLREIGAQDVWMCSFTKMHTKKCNIKFQFVRKGEDARTICVRTKPGGKQTCWESVLRVPAAYDVEEVIDLLKRVDPRTLELRKEHTRMTIPATRIENQKEQVEAPVKEIVLPAAIATPDEFDAPLREFRVCPSCKTRLPLDMTTCDCGHDFNAVPITEEQPESVVDVPADIMQQSKFDLTLPVTCNDVCNDPAAINRGLVALAEHMTPANGYYVYRPMAMHIITNQLCIEQFVANHQYYHTPHRVASLILKGLCDDGLLARCTYGANGRKKSDVNTKGYIITPKGTARLGQVSDIFRVRENESVAIAPETIKEQTPPEPQDMLHKVERQAGMLQSLLEQLERLESDMVVHNEFLADHQARKAEVDQKIHDVSLQLLKLEEELAEWRKKQDAIAEEGRQIMSDRTAAQQQVEEIKEKMRQALT